MPGYQFTSPLIIQDGRVERLSRVPLEERSQSEDWLQQLLFDYPHLLPVHELEPVFDGIIPVARELQTDCGPLDLLYVNPQGYLTLIETKLWRNPESRRAVVGQIIDYAQAISKWTYDDLCSRIPKAKEGKARTLWDLVSHQCETGAEASFIDTVNRGLKAGRFLLLIVGDGIQEGVEQMADFLQRTPQLAFTLGLVEIGLYRLEGARDNLIVQPRILARTKEVVRAIVDVRIQDGEPKVEISLPSIAEQDRVPANRLSFEAFLQRLAKNGDSASIEFAKWVVESAQGHRLKADWGKNSFTILYPDEESGWTFNLGRIDASDEAVFYQLNEQCVRLGLPDRIWQAYFEGIVSLVPGTKIRAYETKKQKWQQVVYREDDNIPLKLLAPKKEKWFELIDQTTTALQEAMRTRTS